MIELQHRAIQGRDAARVKNPGGQVVMRRAAAAQRRLLIRQNLGGQRPPPASHLAACLGSMYLILDWL